MNKYLSILLCVFLVAGFASCKKSYTCKCYSYKRNKATYFRAIGSYELKEKDRETADMICRSRNYTNQITNDVIDCQIAK